MSGKVVVVGSDTIQTGELAKHLSWKFQLKFVDNSGALIECCQKVHPDVLLFDISSPSIKMLDAFIAIRNRYNSNIPFIVAVSENRRNCEMHVRKEGIYFYIVKPYDYAVLEDIIGNACRVFRETALKYQIRKVRKKYKKNFTSAAQQLHRLKDNFYT